MVGQGALRILQTRPHLIGLDWGTSTLRAYLLGDDGSILDRRAQPSGIMSAGTGRDFAATFAAVTRAWSTAHPGLPAIAAGMIGSTEGWVQAPYCPCPASLDELASRLVTVPTGDDRRLSIIPGLELRGVEPNVMRGEETQIVGALSLMPKLWAGAIVVLPGTHSKWVEVRADKFIGFDTYMTGELYALLADGSILGRPARAVTAEVRAHPDGDHARNAAFDHAVGLVRAGGARGGAPLLFLTRSLVLAGSLQADVSLDFLSGLLIGEELRSALPRADLPLVLVGDAALCARYARALAIFDRPAVEHIDDSAPAGLWQIAQLAGLLGSAAAHG